MTELDTIVMKLVVSRREVREWEREMSDSQLSPPRALVAEALEISFFMARLTDDEKNVDLKLELKEWAR